MKNSKKQTKTKKKTEASLDNLFGIDNYFIDSRERCTSDPIDSVHICECPQGWTPVRISVWKADVLACNAVLENGALFCEDDIYLKLIVFVAGDGTEILMLSIVSYKADDDKMVRQQCTLPTATPDDFEELEKALEEGPTVPGTKQTWSAF